MNDALIIDPAEGGKIGRDPRDMTPEELNAAGHQKQPLLAAIRAKCLDCCGGAPSEVRKCTAISCPLWPYRMRTNPFRAPRKNHGNFGRNYEPDDGEAE